MRYSQYDISLGSHGQTSLIWPQWSGPTFGEFLERVEHEFGASADTSGILLLGLRRDEQLEPTDIEALCSQLGVPAEDFGVGP